jgi:hypothetical protein
MLLHGFLAVLKDCLLYIEILEDLIFFDTK